MGLLKKEFFKGKKKIIIPILVVALLGISFGIWSKNKGEELPMVSTTLLEKGSIEKNLSITGKVK